MSLATFNVVMCDQPDITSCYWALNPDEAKKNDPGPYSAAMGFCCSGITCPHIHKYSSLQLLQMRFQPMDVGCSSWEACEFHDPPTVQNVTENAPMSAWMCNPYSNQCPSSGFSCDPFYPNMQWGIVTKTGYDTSFAKQCCSTGNTLSGIFCDPTWVPGSQVCAAILNPPAPCADLPRRNPQASSLNRPLCCLGQQSDPSQCAPDWCPLDPAGSCTDVLVANCQTQSSCGRHALLVDPICNAWYTAASQAGHPAQSTLQGVIADFCNSPQGQVAGECACRNAYELISNLENPPILGQSGENPLQATLRRVDLYCVPGAATTAAIAADPTGPLAQLCSTASQGTTPINPIPTNGLPTWLPPHCWLPDCQPNSAFCRFADPREDLLACPNTCVQISGGNQISIGSLNTQAVMINDLFTSCNFADSAQPLGWNVPLFSIQEAGLANELELCVVPGTKITKVLTIQNNAQDPHWASLSSVPFGVSTSLSPLLSVTPNTGTLTSGGTAQVTLTVDTSTFPTDDLTAYNGFLGVFDSTGANNPVQVLVSVRTVPAGQAGGNGECSVNSAEAPPPRVRVQAENPVESDFNWMLVGMLAAVILAIVVIIRL